MKLKKLIGLVLAVVMVMSLMTLAFAADGYTDVDKDEWYYEAVDFVTDEGLMDGVSATSFAPGEAATRATLVIAFYRLEGSPEVGDVNVFSDVEDDGTDLVKAIIWASENDLVLGYGDGRFGPNDPITREQLVTLFHRYYQFKGYDTEKSAELDFSDAEQVGDWALTAMQWAVAEGMVEGMGDGTVLPKGTTTRSHLAKLIYNAFARKVTFTENWYFGKDTEVTVVRGRTVEPLDKPKRAAHVFSGWFTKAAGGEKFDFETPIHEDTTIYAQWWMIYIPDIPSSAPPSSSSDPGSSTPPTGAPST